MTFFKLFAAAVGSATLASAFSLYDTAPAVGLPESQAAEYSASVHFGGDTNPRGTTNKRDRKSSAYVNASVSTSYADVESVNRLRYSLRLGASHYLGTQSNGGQKYYGDCSGDVSLSHSFSVRSQYAMTAHLSYMPEPGYDNGFSSAGMRGDSLSWNQGNTYSEAIDARWSWHMGCNFSGTKYKEKVQSYDDRQYCGVNFGVNFRESDRLTYTTSVSYRDELRSEGMNSQSAFGALGVQYALDPVSSASASLGVQCKMMAHRYTYNPTLDLGYRRHVSDGLSMSAYVKYSDENVDNYNRSSEGSYRSCPSWRAGVYGTYMLSPDVSYVLRMQVMQTNYRKPTNAQTQPSSRYSLSPSVGLNYSFTQTLRGNLMADYTFYHYDRGSQKEMYARLKYSAGLTYSF